MNGFSVRVAAQCNSSCRALEEAARGLVEEGIEAPAQTLGHVAQSLERLSQEAAAEPDTLSYDQVGAVTHDGFRAVRQVVSQVRTLAAAGSGREVGAFLRIAIRLEKVARTLRALNVDSFQETQPIHPRKPNR